MTCPTCGAEADPSARFCSSCGSEIRHRGDERRVVTVLFGDLVGFTSLSETRDPETVKNLVDRCFARLATDITAFGGIVDKVIGDAIVALFGAPMAHEDDAERAVRAALRMQQTLDQFVSDVADAELRMRIGVNTGEVLVGALRAGGDYTAMGDVVNTAARLQTAAEPGEVLVGDTTHAATERVVSYEERPSLQAKGREAPVVVWSARRALVPPGSRPHRYNSRLVGRDRELSLLHAAWRTSAANERATFALLTGDAGLGKTRLANELAAIAVSEGAAVLKGRCVPYGEANVWWPVAEAIRTSCMVETSDPYPVALSRTRERVGMSLGGSVEPAERDRVATGLLHFMGFDEAMGGVEAANAHDEAVRSLVAYMEGFARQNPLLIIFSDLHWADDVVLELTDTLLERLARAPVTMLSTAREALTDRWMPRAGRHNLIRLNLDPLGPDGAAELLTSLLGQEPTPELAQAMLERSGGNPFFIEELATLMSEAGAAPDDGASAVPVLPATLQGLVAARLDALTPDQRTILQDAAVLGHHERVQSLRTMAAEMHQHVDVDAVLASLVADDLFDLDLDRWSFRSELVREVAYGTITKADRAKRHEGIADWISRHEGRHLTDHLADRLAYHYGMAAALRQELGGPVDPELRGNAVHWLSEAARRAADAEILSVAIGRFTQALDMLGPSPSPERRELLLGRAKARTEAWELDAAHVDAEAVRAEAAAEGDEGGEACAVVRLGDVAQKAGRLSEASDLLGDAVRRFEAIGDEAGLAEALRLLGMTQLFSGDFAQAEQSVLAAQEAFRSCGDQKGGAWALQNLAWIAFVEGRIDDADQRLENAVAGFAEIRDPVGRAWARGLLGFVRMQQGRVREAEAIAQPILQEAQERGDKWATGIMMVLLASLRLWAGRTDEAAERAQAAYEQLRDLGDGYGQTLAAAVAGRALAMSGQVDDGLGLLHDARSALLARQVGEAGAMLGATLLLLAVQLGDVEMAQHWVDQLGAGEGGRPHQLGDVTLTVGEAMAALQRGDRATAQEVLGADALARRALVERHPEAAGPAALIVASAGQREEAAALAQLALDDERATYLDLVLAEVAMALVAAGSGDGSAAGWAQRAQARAEATQDRLAQLMVHRAVAVIDRVVGDDHGEAGALRGADRVAGALGRDGAGWRVAFEAALAGASPSVPA